MNQQSMATINSVRSASGKGCSCSSILPAALCVGGLVTYCARTHTNQGLAAETQRTAAEPVAVFHAATGRGNGRTRNAGDAAGIR